MGDKPKHHWHFSPAMWGGIIIVLLACVYVKFFSPDWALLGILAIIADTLGVAYVYVDARKRKAEERPALFALLAVFLLATLGVLNGIIFHISISYEVTLALLIACLIGGIVAFLMVGRAKDISRRQAAQQKLLDQTKLQPLYGEQAKAEQVKEQ